MAFDPTNVDLTIYKDTGDFRDIICFLTAGENSFDGFIGKRVAALFTICATTAFLTFTPIIMARVNSATHGLRKKGKYSKWFYLLAKYFGSGVILSTAFVHLLDPAYEEIGPASCVGMTGGWALYSWIPAIVLATIISSFLIEFTCEQYVIRKYATPDQTPNTTTNVLGPFRVESFAPPPRDTNFHTSDENQQDDQHVMLVLTATTPTPLPPSPEDCMEEEEKSVVLPILTSEEIEETFRKQIAAFFVLELGVIFHSVIVGLNLGTVASDEFSILFVVIVFHQCFEGLGVGSRLSSIPFPTRLEWLRYALVLAYSVATPIGIAIGLGARTTYNSGSFTANAVSGVLDATSAGVLIYTSLVEMVARDFLFDPDLTTNKVELAFMVIAFATGAGTMSLLGKWA